MGKRRINQNILKRKNQNMSEIDRKRERNNNLKRRERELRKIQRTV